MRAAPLALADTRPVPGLTVPRGISLYVLRHQRRSLASPGTSTGPRCRIPRQQRDRRAPRHAFRLPAHLHENEEIAVETRRALTATACASGVGQVGHEAPRPADSRSSRSSLLAFDAIQPGTSQRYVVIADRYGV